MTYWMYAKCLSNSRRRSSYIFTGQQPQRWDHFPAELAQIAPLSPWHAVTIDFHPFVPIRALPLSPSAQSPPTMTHPPRILLHLPYQALLHILAEPFVVITRGLRHALSFSPVCHELSIASDGALGGAVAVQLVVAGVDVREADKLVVRGGRRG